MELSHPVEHGMRVYPGLPAPEVGAIETAASVASGFRLTRVTLSGNSGTYLDAPFHRHPDAPDLATVPLETIAGVPGVVAEATVGDDRRVELHGDEAEWRGCALLISTGWDERWGTSSYWEPGPCLAGAELARVVRGAPTLVGVDFWNIDDIEDPARPAHTRLLGAGVPIVEHLTGLKGLPGEFRFFAVPPPIVAGASFPVRAFAEVGRSGHVVSQ